MAALACSLIPGPGVSFGFALAGLVGLASGGWVLSARPWRPDAQGVVRLWQLWLGLVLLLGSLAVLVGAWAFFTGSAGAVRVSSAIGGAGFVCAFAAIVSLARSGAARHVSVRLGLDCLVGAVSIAFLVWAADIGPSTGYRAVPEALIGLAVVMGHLTVFVAICLVAARQQHRATVTGVLGFALMTVAAILAVHAMSTPDLSARALATSCWVLGFPLLAHAIRDYRLAGPSTFHVSDADLRDTRASAAVALTSIIGVGAALALLWLNRRQVEGDPRLPLVFLMLVVGGFCAHEAMYVGFRYRITRGLLDLAFSDPLTGLANRRALGSAIASLRPGQSWSVVDLDLDGFKQLNEVLGHEHGDDVLLAVADELTAASPEGATVARIGGDEFALLVPLDLVQAEAFAERLLSRLRDLLGRLGAGLPLSVSLGVGRVSASPAEPDTADGAVPGAVPGAPSGAVPGASSGTPAGTPSGGPDGDRRGAERLSALADAAAALRSAQAGGHNRVAVYTGAVASARERSKQVERCLPAAIQRHEITAHGQVVVQLSDGRISGIEALARWTSPVLGAVRPDEFIPVAERGAALIGAMGSQILRYSVRRALDTGLVAAGLHIAVNVSPVQLRNPHFVPIVRAIVEEYRLPSSQLVLEVTEQVLVDDEIAAVALVQLKDLGVGLAIDDFGAGYSALSYLRRIPMDVLKIDRQWTVDAVHDRRTRDVVATVNDLAHRLGAVVVMEGVEDAEVAALCRDLGADHAQGWHFGRPEPFDVLAPKTLRHNESIAV